MNSYIVFVAVLLLQVALSFSGPAGLTADENHILKNDLFERRSHVVKRADDLLTNEIDLSLNNIDNTEELKRVKLVQRQAQANNGQSKGHNNSTLCDVIGSFVAQGASSLSSIVTDMTRILQQLCASATQSFFNQGQSKPSNSS